MKKPVKKTSTKQASSAANVVVLKKEFKAKLAELSKQFDKQLVEVKKSAQAKALKDVHDSFAKHAKTKDKAVKDAITQVDKAHNVKLKATASAKSVTTKVGKSASLKKKLKKSIKTK